MELHQLECFIELSKFQNVSVTAQHLNISQPTLSKTISLLESELGVKLFDRVGRRIYLNNHGRIFARYVGNVMEMLQEGTATVKTLEYRPSGTVSIGLFAYTGHISECVHAFLRENPLVKFDMYSSKSQYTVDNFDNLHFVITSSLSKELPKREDYLGSIPVEEEDYVLILAPEILEQYAPGADPENVDLSAFRDAPFLSMADNLLFSDITQNLCQQAGFAPHLVVRTNDFATKLHQVALGTAAAFLPEICVPVVTGYRKNLLVIRPRDTRACRTIFLNRRKSSLASHTCDSFWEFAKKYYLP